MNKIKKQNQKDVASAANGRTAEREKDRNEKAREKWKDEWTFEMRCVCSIFRFTACVITSFLCTIIRIRIMTTSLLLNPIGASTGSSGPGNQFLSFNRFFSFSRSKQEADGAGWIEGIAFDNANEPDYLDEIEIWVSSIQWMCVTAFGSIEIVSERLCLRAGRGRLAWNVLRQPKLNSSQRRILLSSLLSGSIGTLSPAKASNQTSSATFHLSHFARH